MKSPSLTGLLYIIATSSPRNNCGTGDILFGVVQIFLGVCLSMWPRHAPTYLGNAFWTKNAKVNMSHSISSNNIRWPMKCQPQEINSPNISPDMWTCSPSRCGEKPLNFHVFLKHTSCTQISQELRAGCWLIPWISVTVITAVSGLSLVGCPQNRLSTPMPPDPMSPLPPGRWWF